MCVKRRLAHLCPDGVQKRDRPKSMPSKGQQANGTASTSYEQTSFNSIDGTDANQAMWTRLSSVEQKLDLLLADRGLQPTSSRQTSSGLHDLANIASDYSRIAKETSSPGQGQGQLAVHADGRSSYVGPHAHSVYLTKEGLTSSSRAVSPTQLPSQSRPGSPTPVDFDAIGQKKRNDDDTSPFDTLTPSNSESFSSLMAWATPGFRSPHSSVAIWNHLSPMLPDITTASRLVNVYYASVGFMHDFIPREEFDKEIWPIFYSNGNKTTQPPAKFQAHKMALLFAILALGVLLDVSRPQRDPAGRALYSCAWNALVLTNFTESTSLDAMLALVHVALYLTWRRAGRYAESAWPLFGLMSSMMVRSGLHRDPAHFDISDADREKRRQVFWDLHGVETLRSLGFCRPPAILDRHVDTRLPSKWKLDDEEEGASAFFAAKSMQTRLINRVLDDCLCATSSYSLTMKYDEKIQALHRAYPDWMKPTILPLARRSKTGNETMEETYIDSASREKMLFTMRSHLTFLNNHQIRLLLHRGWFSEALQQSSETGSNGQEDGIEPGLNPKRFQASVDAVNQSASKIVELVISAWSHYPSLVLRWTFFWNAIFSAAVCRGLFAVKKRKGAEAHSAWRDLRAAIALLRLAVDGWRPLESPLGILLRLDKRAEMALGSAAGKSSEEVKGEMGDSAGDVVHDHAQAAAQAADAARAANLSGEDLNLIGDAKRRSSKSSSKHGLDSPSTSSTKRGANGRPDKRVRIQEKVEQGTPNPTSFDPSSIQSTFTSLATPFDGLQSSAGNGFDFSLFSPHDLTMPASLPGFMVGGTAGNANDDVLPVSSTVLPGVSEMMPLPSINPDGTSSTDTNAFGSSSNATQLIQMLSAGVGWDDISSWDNAIFDL
ncbi:uncharacterized protein FA14DRAFT_51337 [Meira miltonrushii]|uniref:Xylanolytic transcriptional activator regulatory domain-containing protein n=1 Tax=Meira miltonrushii TaxID=1280837 RepID=A0A316VEP0_9BASI|nr:uncharacterized protein FA14DRAFT_51337 [Meira miltonrushii]PWN36052.1 hypothetical protein FA14DRAFT_51337 [Meira miltonrushii]